MLRFEQHTATKWNVFRGENYFGSLFLGDDGGYFGSSSLVSAAELRQIAVKLDELNAHIGEKA